MRLKPGADEANPLLTFIPAPCTPVHVPDVAIA